MRCGTYFITFTTYGTRVHGDSRGSFLRPRAGGQNLPVDPDPFRELRERHLMTESPMTRTGPQRRTVADSIQRVSKIRAWKLHAVNVRTNHVHAVVAADAEPERVMNSWKSRSTRDLRSQGLLRGDGRVWTRHGSTLWVNDAATLSRAMAYVLEGQGMDLGGIRWEPFTGV